MPRKTKEPETLVKKDDSIKERKSTTSVKTKNEKKPSTRTKKVDTIIKKTSSAKSTTKKSSTSVKKTASKKLEAKTKVTEKTPKRADVKNKSKSEKNIKKIETKNTKNSVKTTKKTRTKKVDSSEYLTAVEYYDLPYRYNQTVVKILAQTPKSLFIYWDISDEDREIYKKNYGEDFFEITYPVLIVHNDTLNYSFEVEINDFANSWYLHVNDSKSNYRIELGRHLINYNDKIKNSYVHIYSSNEMESPNDHILFDINQKMIYFKNVKTNLETVRDMSNLFFIKNMGKIYNIYDLYKKLYSDEDIYNSNNPSSNFK